MRRPLGIIWIGRFDRQSFDDAGQLLQSIENYQADRSGPAINRTTSFTYNSDGRMLTLTALNSATGDQVTQWIYGTTLADSKLASNGLVQRKVYPDGGVVSYAYDASGALTAQTDQNGTQRLFLFDKLGRPLDDCAAILGAGVDGAVRRITRSYEVRGLLFQLTSASASTPGSGTVVNQVQYDYNSFGQPITEYQEHSGAVNTASTPRVRYAYVDGASNTTRRTSITYPSGREIGYTYGDADSPDDLLNRVTAITDDATARARYQRLGAGTFIQVAYQEPGFAMTFLRQPGESNGDAGDQYIGLDRFDRVVDIRWLVPGTTPLNELERVKYGFDRAGNRLWRQEAVAPGGGFDEAYSYDGLYQLATRKRGTLSGLSVTSLDQEEDFTYDPTGNWPAYQLTENGVVVLNQTRTHNSANETTGITNLPGHGVATAYDPAGNMTIMPKMADWNTSQTLTWDAWNRLRTITEGATAIGSYEYDGGSRRSRKVVMSGGSPEVRHSYYSDQWQVLEERAGGTTAERQFLWGDRSIDDLILRDLPGDSPSRFYAMQDQWSVTAITDHAGLVQERYSYRGFGMCQVLTPIFHPRVGSMYDWEVLFASYRVDTESHLYSVRRRYLHVSLARWLTRDPAEDRQTLLNLFRYVSNNPSNEIDPTGLKPRPGASPTPSPLSGGAKHPPAGGWGCDKAAVHNGSFVFAVNSVDAPSANTRIKAGEGGATYSTGLLMATGKSTTKGCPAGCSKAEPTSASVSIDYWADWMKGSNANVDHECYHIEIWKAGWQEAQDMLKLPCAKTAITECLLTQALAFGLIWVGSNILVANTTFDCAVYSDPASKAKACASKDAAIKARAQAKTNWDNANKTCYVPAP